MDRPKPLFLRLLRRLLLLSPRAQLGGGVTPKIILGGGGRGRLSLGCYCVRSVATAVSVSAIAIAAVGKNVGRISVSVSVVFDKAQGRLFTPRIKP